jgi:2-phosphosulfolactate phosphatase
MGIFDQQEFEIRLEWGLEGVEILAPISDVIIIVDVLSFSTCVDFVTCMGVTVYPYRWKDETAKAYATQIGAALAGPRDKSESSFSLSPASFLDVPLPEKLVLPSANGSTLSLATGNAKTICGCLRNAEAVARHAMQLGNKIAIIPAGEQWPGDSLRPAFEDLLGAGAIISFLKGSLSPESKAALAVFKEMRNMQEQIKRCSSGKELIAKGFESDVRIASDFNVSKNVPMLVDGAYRGLIF